ncbi:Uncharacterised protein [Salmonella enterica subsp. enterica]|uniref:Uncharacterized protein n=1 Tax=Salmonella enterica I TaxID=59201 RepID=A0A447PCH7_SALET|nr:Uncharacterised protein [Salmonella enterica subsp. enterica]
MGKYLLFHRHNVVKLLLWIGMECGDIHYVIECASCCSPVLLSGFQKQASLVFENQTPACRLCDCLPYTT